MKYLLSLSLALLLSSFLCVEAFSFKKMAKRATALTVMPVVCVTKASFHISGRLLELPLKLGAGLLDGAEMWAAGG